MTDLTEQWKKGELLGGWYYVKKVNEQQDIAECYKVTDTTINVSHTEFEFSEDIEQVLAKVPTYSEYLALQSDSLAKNEGAEIVAELEKRLKKTQGLELDLRRKNHELKELLKECKHIMSIEKDFASCHFEKDKLAELLNKIEEAIK